MSESHLELLRHVTLFGDLKGDNAALSYIHTLMEHKKFPKGHILTEQGKAGNEFFVLTVGQVSIFKKTPEGDPYKVAVLAGDKNPAFGEGGLMEGEVRSATITCDTDVECFVLTREAFNTLGETHPQYAFPIIRRIAMNLMKTLSQTSHDLMLLHQALMSEIRSS